MRESISKEEFLHQSNLVFGEDEINYKVSELKPIFDILIPTLVLEWNYYIKLKSMDDFLQPDITLFSLKNCRSLCTFQKNANSNHIDDLHKSEECPIAGRSFYIPKKRSARGIEI